MTTHPATGEALHTVSVVVNGGLRTAQVPARRLLSDFLRHDLGLTGTHVGCEHGVCGACTVLVDGAPMRSCLMFAVSAEGHEITTVEGLAARSGAAEGDLGPVSRPSSTATGCSAASVPRLPHHGHGIPREQPRPDAGRGARGDLGNLCRCTGYQNIVTAVCRAAELIEERGI